MQPRHRKVCILGASGVGKTSLIRYFVYGTFERRQINAARIQVSRKTMTVSHATRVVEITLVLWDIKHFHQLRTICPNVLRNIDGAILVCDINRPQSFDLALQILDVLYQSSPSVTALVALNKIDLLVEPPQTLSQQVYLHDQANAVLGDYDLPIFLTSSKSGLNIDALFHHMGQVLVSEKPTTLH